MLKLLENTIMSDKSGQTNNVDTDEGAVLSGSTLFVIPSGGEEENC